MPRRDALPGVVVARPLRDAVDVRGVARLRLRAEGRPVPGDWVLHEPVDRELASARAEPPAGRRGRARASPSPRAGPAAAARPRAARAARSAAGPRAPSAACSPPASGAPGPARWVSRPSCERPSRGFDASKIGIPGGARSRIFLRERRHSRVASPRGEGMTGAPRPSGSPRPLPATLLYLIKGIFVGMVIAVPAGPVGVLCVRRTFFEGALFGIVSGLGRRSPT